MISACSSSVAAPAEPRPAGSRCSGQEIGGRVESVEETGGTFRLSGGETVRLADIRLAEGEARSRARAVLASFVGRELRGRAGPADRWGVRTAPALATADDGLAIAELLVAEGYAWVDPGEADTLCNPLLAVEAKARQGRLGIWREGGVVDGTDAGAVAGRIGHFAIVEGRIVSVGERPTRTYLNMGRAGSGALTITLSKRRWAEWRQARGGSDTVRGRRVRVRGLIEPWRSPTLDVSVIETLELLAEEPLTEKPLAETPPRPAGSGRPTAP